MLWFMKNTFSERNRGFSSGTLTKSFLYDANTKEFILCGNFSIDELKRIVTRGETFSPSVNSNKLF